MILVLDIDNTLADCSHRVHLLKDSKSVEDLRNFMAVEEVTKDSPFPKAQEALKLILPIIDKLYVVTGRNEYLREITQEWLKKHFGLSPTAYTLIMRPTGELSHATDHKIGRLSEVLFKFYNKSILFIDDDPFVLHEYSKYGLALKAPECWDLMVHEKPEKEEPLFGK